MELLNLRPEDINAYDNNPRINDHAVQDMARLIEAHGFRVPVLVRLADDGTWDLIDGHLRMKAVDALGLEEVPALDVSDMDEAQVASFRISVNRASELADWDVTKLVQELDNIELPEDDLPTLTGMNDAYLSGLLDEPAVTVQPAPPTQAGSQAREQSADPVRVRGDDDTVSLSLSMTLAQRRDALARLSEIQQQHSLGSRAEAFLHLLRPEPRTRTRRRAT